MNRRAFTLVEVLVALMMLAVAVAGLVSALTGDRRLRDMAAAHSFAADRARERIELLAVLACTADTSGTAASASGTEHWRASPSQSEWSLTDSVVFATTAPPVVIRASVACPE
ncbi:MAG TPA: type II secretion system protein [Gemmatimonadaceae bacterium]|jgi:prepilin-type N-terminal cleavage/methylation domain-containing protein|nr:type II secretion system protein [Gemmatimonadaceae bacterium]